MKDKKQKVPDSADDKEQSERFIKAALETGNVTATGFERAFKMAVPPTKKKRSLR